MPYYFNSTTHFYPERKKYEKLLVAGSFMVGGNAGDVAPLIALRQFLERKEIPLAIEILSSSSSAYESFDYFYYLDQLNLDLVRYLCDNTKLLLVIGGGAFFGVETVLNLRVFIEQLKIKTALFCIGTDYKHSHDQIDQEKKLLLKKLLENISHLSTRSNFAQKTCLDLGITPTEEKPIGDIVHLMDTMPGFYNLREGFTVAVNIRGLWNETPFLDYMAQLLDLLIAKKKAKIIFLPFSFRNDPDSFTHRYLVEKMKFKEKTFVIQQHIYPAHLQDIISQMDLLIGMRLHANIMAYNTQTPFIAINYHPKVKGFLEEVGLANQILLSGNENTSNDFYGYAPPQSFPSLEESLEKIEQALLSSPSLNPKVQRAKIESNLTQLLKKSFSFHL